MSRGAPPEPFDLQNQDQTLLPSTFTSTSVTFIPQANVQQVPSIVDLSSSTPIPSHPTTQGSTNFIHAKVSSSRQQHSDTQPTVSISKSSTSLPGAKPLQFINNLAPVVPRPKPTPNALYIQTQSAVQQKLRKQAREEGKIKRSSNCFIMYRTHIHPLLVARYGNQNNKEISRLAGRCWRNEPESVKSVYRQQAHQEKIKHANLYPAYKYTPARAGQSSSLASATKDKNKALGTHADNDKTEKEKAKTTESSSSTPSKQATTDSPVKDQEESEDMARQTGASSSMPASSHEQERGKKKRPNLDHQSSTPKKFLVTETALHNFTGDTVPDLPVAKKARSARPRQPVSIPDGRSAVAPVSMAEPLSGNFDYSFSFPPNDTSLSMDMDQTDDSPLSALDNGINWDAEMMSASLTFNPLFLNGSIDSNDVWSPDQTSSPVLNTPLLDLPLSSNDYPWLQSPPLTTPTLELSPLLFSSATSGPVKQASVSSFSKVCFTPTITPLADVTGQIGGNMNSGVVQNGPDAIASLGWGFESMSTLSAVSPCLPTPYSDYTPMTAVSNDMSFGLAPSTAGVTSDVRSDHVPSRLSTQPQLSSAADHCNGTWLLATAEPALQPSSLPFDQPSWDLPSFSPLQPSTVFAVSSVLHADPKGPSSCTPFAMHSTPAFQFSQKPASSGNTNSAQSHQPHQQLQQPLQQQVPSTYGDLSCSAFQWSVPERHSSLLQEDTQPLHMNDSQKISDSNLILDTIDSAGSMGGTAFAPAVMALALAANDHGASQLVNVGSSTFASTLFSDQECQQQQQQPPAPLPPLLPQPSSCGNHGTGYCSTFDDNHHSNGTNSDRNGESEEELSKSIAFYERIVQQQKMRLTLQRQLKSASSGDFLHSQFRQQHR
ncbi:hypothetical protein EMPS_11479 [Entomortierella parvispora]|uniref:HMG box domain-containing protein n=1 Tax=Entomortierella parvispora TaxID=205924 RepID=A0A9P3M2Q4_9FUNG|nr:hypothetical protein EMPS_11479 [Entomortierella parvispora]